MTTLPGSSSTTWTRPRVPPRPREPALASRQAGHRVPPRDGDLRPTQSSLRAAPPAGKDARDRGLEPQSNGYIPAHRPIVPTTRPARFGRCSPDQALGLPLRRRAAVAPPLPGASIPVGGSPPARSEGRRSRRKRSAASHAALDDRGGSGHGAAHDAVPGALAADEREARPLEEGARPVVEHGLLLALRVVRVALDDATARLRDQVEGALQRDGRQPLSPVAPVHEDAGDPVVGDEVSSSSYCLRW